MVSGQKSILTHNKSFHVSLVMEQNLLVNDGASPELIHTIYYNIREQHGKSKQSLDVSYHNKHHAKSNCNELELHEVLQMTSCLLMQNECDSFDKANIPIRSTFSY